MEVVKNYPAFYPDELGVKDVVGPTLKVVENAAMMSVAAFITGPAIMAWGVWSAVDGIKAGLKSRRFQMAALEAAAVTLSIASDCLDAIRDKEEAEKMSELTALRAAVSLGMVDDILERGFEGVRGFVNSLKEPWSASQADREAYRREMDLYGHPRPLSE